ncbi:LysR substrate-binding domain-containing protein [soil metagenome]
MPEPLVVAFVVGVTPGKWARAWQERMPRHPLTLLPLGQHAALAALADGTAQLALLRLPLDTESAGLSTIPLYAERPVVVAATGHAIEAADSVTLAELAGFGILPTGDADPDWNDETGWANAVAVAATNAAVAIMPQSVARAHSRKDVVARPVTDAPETRIALAWPTAATTAATTDAVQEFIGIVRGRTANSSRGAQAEDPAGRPAPRQAAKRSPAANRSPAAKTARPWSKLKPRGKKR